MASIILILGVVFLPRTGYLFPFLSPSQAGKEGGGQGHEFTSVYPVAETPSFS